MLHQPAQLGCAGGPPGQERVVGQDPAAALGAQGVELALPQLTRLGRRLDQAAAADVGQVAVLLPVVERPLDRHLDEARAALDRQLVGGVGVHEAGVVEEAAFGEQRRRPPRQVPHGRAVALRPHPGDPVERLQAAVQRRDLLGEGQGRRLLVQVAVVADLVAGVDDRPHGVGVALGAEPRHEEGRRDPVPLEQPQQAGHADERTVRLVAHHAHPVGVPGGAPQHRRLGVEVEGEGGGRRAALRPGRRRRAGHLAHRSALAPAMSVTNS